MPALPRTAWQTVVDFGVISAVLIRSVSAGRRDRVGRFVHRDVGRVAPGAGPVAAWLAVVATYSPNAYVLDVDSASGRALLHDLRPLRASEEPV
ncbi:hypothetical protein [Streptomyces sp. Ru72]|uniref:hypothetical protein n=1 Tax=Streptomyces sp. Ru72 TaxID=2080747 RepID=UPI0015E3F866|nr:hypothetical protein [Streptomyces sp. Ru72]